jgi:hypothetical protein
VSESPTAQAQAFKPKQGSKIERCIVEVKSSLRKRNPKMKGDDIKSAAIAICRSRLKQ